jgi:hypothetical protein
LIDFEQPVKEVQNDNTGSIGLITDCPDHDTYFHLFSSRLFEKSPPE